MQNDNPQTSADENPKEEPAIKFTDFDFSEPVMQGIKDMRYETPTAIQAQSIPPILRGSDLIANAQTGSGKTAAFLLPLIQRIHTKPANASRILVIAPTRELACQIDEQVLGFGYRLGLKSVAIYGGVRMEVQEQAIRAGTPIIIATPGRLLDHHKYGYLDFSQIESIVLDEADRMLDMGFWPDIQKIFKLLPDKIQILLFSATMPEPIVKLAKTMMHNPEHVKIGLVRPPSSISQYMLPVLQRNKEDLVVDMLKTIEIKNAIIFTATKIGAERLYRALDKLGISCGVIHGDRDQSHRDEILNQFKSGTMKLLVATDVASRGIDISALSHVINFDIPGDDDTYIHRIGRTARGEGMAGEAYTLYTPDEENRVQAIEKAVGKEIPRYLFSECQGGITFEHFEESSERKPGRGYSSTSDKPNRNRKPNKRYSGQKSDRSERSSGRRG